MLTYSSDYTNILPYIVLCILAARMVCWWIIFRKMHIRPWLCLVPIIGDYQIFRRCWRGWPYVVLTSLTIVLSIIVPLTGYMDMNLPFPGYIKTRLLSLALICYLLLQILKYKHLAFAFGHDILFLMGLLFLNPIFLGILALPGSRFSIYRAKLRGEALKRHNLAYRTKAEGILSLVCALLLLGAAAAHVADFVLTEHQPAYFILKNNEKLYAATAGKVSGRGPVISPRFQDGNLNKEGVRNLYFPHKAGFTETTVYLYMIGSDLEEAKGSASVNLAQIKDATAASDNLRFIVQAGGSGRWFTKGIKNLKAGRYMIQGGKVTLLEDLGRNVCMSKPEALRSFLQWANRHYPSQRRMLFFWDHGGALAGYGMDQLNPRVGRDMLSMKEIRDSLKASGVRYDLIGFDACLMQSLEVGLCLEPYADYLLASEEGEPSTGMYYTAAFQALAKNPGMSTVEFGSMMCASFDQSLVLYKGTEQAGSTLSLVDLRFLPVVRDTFFGYLKELQRSFRHDKDSFLSMSTTRSKTYEFLMDDQIDLIDYLKQSDLPSSRKSQMIDRIKDAVVVRNKASANHINGLSVYMPFENLPGYGTARKALRELGMKREAKIYDDFASILASQKTTKRGKVTTQLKVRHEDWFNKDFANYDLSLYRQNIPLKKYTGKPLRYENHVIDLSEKDWALITNYELGMHLKVGTRYADLGSDNIYDRDENGHYMVGNDKKWVAINDVLVALHPGPPIEVDENTIVYTGTVDATLNYNTPITIYLQWVNEGDNEGDGEVLGYLPADADTDNFDKEGMPRGYRKFKPNNVLTFLYDWYDKDGNYLKTAMGHRPILLGVRGLTVTQKDISTEEYEYFGILYDVMNRTMETRHLTHKAEK
ncbi:clostripain-related cysteine peptidase [Eubacterium sp. AB3007]|uniref:clostripain-related cysteine peptidase n=1 Tax=Eubacterium sp. AB3007 TaxID=1392487 RepID=UPI0004886ED4|nr:clostripain-related cysteine peptidase [Eubacterium sp. AB3007]